MKIKSIRRKILWAFSTTFLVLLLLLLMINRFFLVDYYIDSNRKNMHDKVEMFIANYMHEDRESLVTELMRDTGGEVVLLSDNLLPTQRPEGHMSKPQKLNHLRIVKEHASALGKEGYFEVVGRGRNIEDKRLLYARIMEDGQLLLITKGMGIASEASGMFFYFMLRTSIIVYLIGFVVIYVIANSISKPIVKMKRVTKKMANLQFDEKLEVKSCDEVGDLMNSVNQMADELSETIYALNVSNDQLARELSKEKSLEKMRRRFVSDVSHELKNPISMILGYADGLVQRIPKTEDAKEEYYGIIVDEANRMNKLVKDLLDLSGYESGTFTIVKEPFIVNELVGNAIERFSYVMDEKVIHIEYDSNQRYELTADRLRVSQVIINILSNAFKHVNDNGIIKIELSKEAEKLKILIANTGKLIPEKELDQIWDSFYQVDTESNGNGLGLAIVKSIVKLHEGSCHAYVTNGYNCFEIRL